ncbi:hypothetical protein F2P79_007552 [Pimephales promelas]|nr:hypothetical protein F2P79_007552 [Pimephales promelas]
MDISRGRRAFEDDGDDENDADTMPLLEANGQQKKSTSMEKNLTVKEKIAKKATYSREQNEKGNKGQERNQAKAAASIRKTKSMEVLPRRVHHAGSGYLDEKELEKKKQEAHKVFVKEKIKFSAFLNEITRQNQKTAIVIPTKNRITIIPIKNLITVIPIKNLITVMPIQNLITIIHHRHLIDMELIIAHHHTIILLQIPIIIHLLHHNTVMELTAAQHVLLSQGLTVIVPIQKLILLTKNHTINIHLHRHITTKEVTPPQFQNLPTVIPVQSLTTIIRLLLLSTTTESMVVHLIFLQTQKLTTSLM